MIVFCPWIEPCEPKLRRTMSVRHGDRPCSRFVRRNLRDGEALPSACCPVKEFGGESGSCAKVRSRPYARAVLQGGEAHRSCPERTCPLPPAHVRVHLCTAGMEVRRSLFGGAYTGHRPIQNGPACYLTQPQTLGDDGQTEDSDKFLHGALTRTGLPFRERGCTEKTRPLLLFV